MLMHSPNITVHFCNILDTTMSMNKTVQSCVTMFFFHFFLGYHWIAAAIFCSVCGNSLPDWKTITFMETLILPVMMTLWGFMRINLFLLEVGFVTSHYIHCSVFCFQNQFALSFWCIMRCGLCKGRMGSSVEAALKFKYLMFIWLHVCNTHNTCIHWELSTTGVTKFWTWSILHFIEFIFSFLTSYFL